jgi:hypothetical protein
MGVELVIGIGVIGVLLRMSGQIGSLAKAMEGALDTLSDHEQRLRKVETND